MDQVKKERKKPPVETLQMAQRLDLGEKDLKATVINVFNNLKGKCTK